MKLEIEKNLDLLEKEMQELTVIQSPVLSSKYEISKSKLL